MTQSYPELTPYQFASNRPIDGIDLDGLEYLDADIFLDNEYGPSPNFAVENADGTFDLVANGCFLALGVSKIIYQGKEYYNLGEHIDDDDGNRLTEWVFEARGPVVKATDNVGYREAGNSCFEAACGTIKNAGYKQNDYYDDTSRQMYKAPKAGGLSVSEQTISEALDLIHTSLEDGKPVLVGVDHSEGHPGNNDQTTDHFIVIVGRGYDQTDGREYFRYYDNTGYKTDENNKLYINAQGILESENGVFRGQNDYKVTHVRSVEENDK